MKKLLAVSIVASLVSASAFATVNTEVSQESNGEASFKGGYTLDNGMSFGAEYVHDFTRTKEQLSNQKDGGKHKETSLNAAWKVLLNDNLWVQPSAEVTLPASDKMMSVEPISGEQVTAKFGNTYKLGMTAGYDFDFGLYTSARYRFDFSEDKLSSGKFNQKLKNQIHRTDLTVGYRIELVDISANWIHKAGQTKTKIDGSSNKAKMKTNDFEFKAALNQYDNVKPYVQYTVKGDIKPSGAAVKLKQDNIFKVGAVVSF